MATRKKVLITGASGFIGRNLFKRLRTHEDLDVWGTYHTRRFLDDPHLIPVDLTDRMRVNEILEGVDVLIQAAAVTSGAKDIVERPYVHLTDNLIMNSLLFQAAYDANVSQVIFFSCTVLYPPNLGRPVRETDLDLHKGIHPKYFAGAWLKVYLEKLCEFYADLGRNRYTVIRHSNIYGPHDKYDLERSHVFGATMTKVMTAPEGGTIKVWGDGKEERDLLYVSDLVDFVERAMDTQDYNFDVFNVGCGHAVSVRELVEKIVRASGKNLTVIYDPTRPTISTRIAVDTTKAWEKFGWAPHVILEEGIEKTLEWYQTKRT